MKIFAYLYSDVLLEDPPSPEIWGWEVDRVYQDLSAGQVGARSQLQSLVEDCQVEPPDYLLLRRLEEFGDTIQAVCDRLNTLGAFGIQIIAIEQDYHSAQLSSGTDSVSNKPVNLRRDLIQLISDVQQNQRSHRIRQGHARNRVQALPPPGKAPYGYRRGRDRYTIDRTASPVVKDFFDHFLIYASLRGAVRHLAKKYNKKIAVSTGKRWLTNPVYRGDLAYRDGEVIRDTHAAIISRQEAAQVDRLLRRNSQMPPRTASAPRSLSGLVTCAECGSAMTVTRVTQRGKKGEYLYLRPTACSQQPKCKAIRYEDVLEQTIQTICDQLPQAVAGLSMPNMSPIKQGIAAQIEAKQNVLAQLPDLVQSGVLDPATADLRTYQIKTELSELQDKLAQLPPVNLLETAQAVSIPRFWLDLTEAERRFYFREFIQQIQIVRRDRTWSLKLVFIF